MSEENKPGDENPVIETPKELRKIPPMSADKMKEFILGVCDGKIFTDRHTRSDHEIPMVFMIVALGGVGEIDPEDIGCIWEWTDKAMPRSVNGMPTFLSCHFMNKKDAAFAFMQIEKEWKRRDNLTLQMELDIDQAMKGREENVSGTQEPRADEAVPGSDQEGHS